MSLKADRHKTGAQSGQHQHENYRVTSFWECKLASRKTCPVLLCGVSLNIFKYIRFINDLKVERLARHWYLLTGRKEEENQVSTLAAVKLAC